jgi:zinc protease
VKPLLLPAGLLAALAIWAASVPGVRAAPWSAIAATGRSAVQQVEAPSDREAPPPPLPVGELSLPLITETRLDNGLDVVVVSKRNLPLLTLRLVIPGGRSAEPEELAGTSQFVASLLNRGTSSRSAQEIASAIEQVGGSLVAETGQDSLTITARVLSEYGELAFQLLGDVTMHPSFPAEELENYRQRAVTSLLSELADPSEVASRAFGAIVYGQHPHGNVTTRQTLTAVSHQAVVAYHQAQFHPEGAVLIVIGDIRHDEAVLQAQSAFGSWQVGQKPPPVPAAPPPTRAQQTVYLVDQPGSSQAQVMLGHLGILGADPRRFALIVANQVLGGGSSSRLYRDLREEKGFTYGIYSYFDFPLQVGQFAVSAAVRNDVIGLALEATLEQLRQLREAPVPPDELDDARSYLIGSYALYLERDTAMASQIGSFKMRGLPLSDLGDYAALIEAVDAEAARQAVAQYIWPELAAIVVVGDAANIRGSLTKIAPVVMVDADGRPIDQ